MFRFETASSKTCNFINQPHELIIKYGTQFDYPKGSGRMSTELQGTLNLTLCGRVVKLSFNSCAETGSSTIFGGIMS